MSDEEQKQNLENTNEEEEQPQQQEEDNQEPQNDQADNFNEYENMPKIEVPIFEKNKGNECFKQGNLDEALKHYSKAQLAVQYLAKDHVINDDELVDFAQKVTVPCQLNSSLCYIRKKDYSTAKTFAEKALELDKENIKGLTRRAICLRKMHEFNKAENDLQQALKLLKENEKEEKQFILQELQNLSEDRKVYNEKLKQASKKMMNGLDYSDKQEEQANKNKQNNSQSNSSIFQKIKSAFVGVKDFIKSKCCKKRIKVKSFIEKNKNKNIKKQ